VEDQNAQNKTGGELQVGWDPMVMQNISSYDGGKVIFGFGRTAQYWYAGWIMKMWGTQGAGGNPCADDAKITGYVFMYEDLNANLGGTANCTLSSNAKTQWAFST